MKRPAFNQKKTHTCFCETSDAAIKALQKAKLRTTADSAQIVQPFWKQFILAVLKDDQKAYFLGLKNMNQQIQFVEQICSKEFHFSSFWAFVVYFALNTQ